MGQQLREIEEGTLKKLAEFIDYTLENPSSPGPVFTVGLKLKDNALVFDPPLEEVVSCVLGVFDDTFFWGSQLMRIDKEVFPIMELTEEPLPGANPTEPEIKQMRTELAEKLQNAMDGAMALQQKYLDKSIDQHMSAVLKLLSPS